MAAVSAAAVLVSGCMASVDADALPGTYRSEETGGQILLMSDGTFSAAGVSPQEATGVGGTGPIDFHGRWEFHDSETSRDFVYLTIEGGELALGGIQLYPSGETVEFNPDPDGPPSLTLTKAATP